MRILTEFFWVLIVWAAMEPGVESVQDCYEKAGVCEGKVMATYEDRDMCVRVGQNSYGKFFSCERHEFQFADSE